MNMKIIASIFLLILSCHVEAISGESAKRLPHQHDIDRECQQHRLRSVSLPQSIPSHSNTCPLGEPLSSWPPSSFTPFLPTPPAAICQTEQTDPTPVATPPLPVTTSHNIITKQPFKLNFSIDDMPKTDIQKILEILHRNEKAAHIIPPQELDEHGQIAKEMAEEMARISEDIGDIICGFSHLSQKNKITNLCIDGGGTRGVIALTILAAFEELTGLQTYELFDHITATSTGSIITALLTIPGIKYDGCFKFEPKNLNKPMTAREAIDFFINLAPTIFGETNGIFSKAYTRYNEKPFETLLETILTDTVLSDCKTHVTITAYNLENQQAVHFSSLNEQQRGKLLRELIMKSTAAPTFFLPTADNHVDGGLAHNNPSAVGVLNGWRHLKKNPAESITISLSNGTDTTPMSRAIFQGSYIMGLAGHVAGIVFNGSNMHEITKTLYDIHECPENYFRLEPPIATELNKVDAIDRPTLEKMIAAAQAYIDTNGPLMERIKDSLLACRKLLPTFTTSSEQSPEASTMSSLDSATPVSPMSEPEAQSGHSDTAITAKADTPMTDTGAVVISAQQESSVPASSTEPSALAEDSVSSTPSEAPILARNNGVKIRIQQSAISVTPLMPIPTAPPAIAPSDKVTASWSLPSLLWPFSSKSTLPTEQPST